jgi:hypothetical protein
VHKVIKKYSLGILAVISSLLVVSVYAMTHIDTMNMLLQHTPMLIFRAILSNVVFAAFAFIAIKKHVRTKVLWAFIALLFISTSYFQLTAPMSLSTDYYRYIWQGRISNAGLNNYELRPWDAGVEKQNNELFERMDWRDVKTVYPPLAEQYFRIHAGLFDAQVFKNLSFESRLAVSKAPNVLLLILAGFLLMCLTKNHLVGSLFVLNPFVQFEFLNSAHIDILAIVFVLAALVFVQSKKSWQHFLVGPLIAAAALTKLTPALLIAPIVAFAWLQISKRVAVQTSAMFAFVLLLSVCTFIVNDFAFIKRLGVWSSGQEFSVGNPVYATLKKLTPEYANITLKIIGIACLLLVLVQLIRSIGMSNFRQVELYKFATLMGLIPLLASPVILPWYFILPLICAILFYLKNPNVQTKKYFTLVGLLVIVLILQYIDKSPTSSETLRHALIYGPLAALSVFQLVFTFRAKLADSYRQVSK